MNRRAFLTEGVLGTTALLAGCIGALGDGGKGPDRDIRLESLDVGGSPGGTIPIRPPGKVTLLDFFATWCAPCKPEMANLRAARERFDPDRVFMVSITQETDEEAIKAFWRKYDGTWPVAMDANLKATRTYGVPGVPTIIVLTPDGTEVMRHTGLAGKERIVTKIRTALEKAGMA